MTRTPVGDECAPLWGSPDPFGLSSRLLRRDRNGKSLPPLGSPSPQNVTATWRGHTGEETMGSFASRVTWLKGSLHEVRDYPSQRVAAVNLFITRQPQRPPRRSPAWPWSALRISPVRPVVSDSLPTSRSCIGPSEARPGAIVCSGARSSLFPLPLWSILRTCRFPSAFVSVLLDAITKRGRCLTHVCLRDLSHHFRHGKQVEWEDSTDSTLPIGRGGATW